MVSAQDIENWLKRGFEDGVIAVQGDGRHFEAVIVSEQFSGKNTLARHRLVYSVLGDKMDETIHALSMQTLTPDEHATK